MCTLIAMWRTTEEVPLVVAANRDEKLDRPAAPPSLRRLNGRRFVAPTDLTGGGTWLGFNDAETFVGITNRHFATKRGPLRSRGLLVLDTLAAGSAREIDRALSDLDVAPYAGFHLFFADRRDAFVLWTEGERLHRIVLRPGVLIMTERSFGAAPTTREQAIRERITRLSAPPDDPTLIALLSTRAEVGFEGINVSVPAYGYGTRSSTILRLGAAPGDVRYLHAEGPPDRAPFVDQAEQLRQLGGEA